MAHRWDISPQEAMALQQELRGRVVVRDDFGPIRFIAGVDNSYVPATETTYAGVVVLSWPDLDVVEQCVSRTPTTFPYVPGLLSFREAPGVLAAIAMLETQPDLFVFDGQGIAHMRGLGLASHLGLVLDRPSIGCAKSKLVGSYVPPGPDQGDTSPLTYRGHVVGTVLRPVTGRKALLFVSPGHRVGVESAAQLIAACCRGRVMPEPTRLAHQLVTRARTEGGTDSAPVKTE
jgi:deoxyribonuclease V